MKIALFIDTVAFAGTERHVLDLGQALVLAGAAVIIVCPVASPLTPRCMAAGLAMLDVPSSLRHGARTVKILAGELRAGRVDIIHAHNGRTHLLAVAAVKLAGRGRVVATQHFLAPNRTGRRGPKAWLAGRLHRWAEKNTAAFIAISQAVKDQMLIRGDAGAEKITVVHNGTPEPEKTSPDRIAALRAELGVGDALMVFCAARLQKEKDIPTLIKAAALLVAASSEHLASDVGLQVTGDRLQGTGEELEVRSWKLEDGATPQALPAGQNSSEAIPNSNSYLLASSSSPQFFIAGEGDQRGECERIINDHGARSVDEKLGVRSWKLEDDDRVRDQKLEVRSWKLEDGATPQASPVGQNGSAALPPHSNSYLLTSNFSQADGGAIRLLGFRSDVSALMAACDLFVLPAPAEPFGLVVIEAMALGKPVIAAGAGGPLEIVANGETGLLFEPGNSESLAAAMKQLLADADLRKRMGEAGRKRYEEMFTAQEMAGKMLAAYAAGR